MNRGGGVWRAGIDTGGTFTDAIAVAPDGSRRRAKLLSTSALRLTAAGVDTEGRVRIEGTLPCPPAVALGLRLRRLDGEGSPAVVESAGDDWVGVAGDPGPLAAGTPLELASDEPAPVFALRLLVGAAGPLPPTHLRLATTLGTNALLQRKGAPVAFFVTRGFRDLLVIGDQQRDDLFRLDGATRRPLYAEVVEVDARMDARGRELRPLTPETLDPSIDMLLAAGIRTAAVALLHGFADGVHEIGLAEHLRRRGFEHVSCSHQLAPRIKILPRAETAVVDATLAPPLQHYLNGVARSLAGGRLLVMSSAGGLLDPGRFHPKDSLLSGPAGGVVGAARAGRRSGSERLISFDMGGTSTDVARYDGDYEYVFEHRVGDARLAAPAMAVETVAAGGGSICWADGERLRVGPDSAGADPGPACYGVGGPLTLTDVNLLLGRLDPQGFGIPVAAEPARARFREVLARLTERPGDEGATLEGLIALADERMAGAIRRISVRRGYDPAEYALIAFGGAGGQHACGVARRLGMTRVIVPSETALLSAVGLEHARVERFVEQQVLRPLDEVEGSLPERFAELERRARGDVAAAGTEPDRIEVRRRLAHLRFVGQESSLQVEWRDRRPLRDAFREHYTVLYGQTPEQRPVELESIRLVASSIVARDEAPAAVPPAGPATPSGSRRVRLDGAWHDAPLYERERLTAGETLDGPALVHEAHSTTVIPAGWRLAVDGAGALVLDATAEGDAPSVIAGDGGRPHAVRLELFTQRFRALVREMGERLERTSVSTNVKERLDFSCALLDPAGELVVNAPHIPVHLGALGLCVRRVREALRPEAGDVIVTNHPAYGGSHLPDVTVITPVFDGGRLLGYTASRAHHAEIGGSRPGSMPPDATRLVEEGVVLEPQYLVRRGEARWDTLRRRLQTGPWPSRAVEDNLADLRAALAANHAGAEALRRLARDHGADTVQHFMASLTALAESHLREALAALPDGVYRARERLDDGSPLEVRIDLAGDRAAIDFSGSSAVHPGNLNATPAIVRSAVLYVLRLLIDRPLPLNEGLLRTVTLEVPPGILAPSFPDDPAAAPAVVGGNVETSQRLVDTLLAALELAACSQGTMNNVIFGNAHYGYYETVGGGCGAGPGFDGASGRHSHMTNTRITDPEILEHRYPVRLERFQLRAGSGGGGRYRGGDGLVREIRFLEPASLSVLSQHRVEEPYGLAGGRPGARGRQTVIRTDGERIVLGAVDGCDVERGDLLLLETPGGGGYGNG